MSKLREYNSLPSLRLSEKNRLPSLPAIYFAVARNQVLYVGKTKELRSRWQGHHRFPELSGINKRHVVRLFWLECHEFQLTELEKQYIEYYCPDLNQTRVPEQEIVPNFQMLKLSLSKISKRLMAIGLCEANNQKMQMLLLGYLAGYTETRGVTNIIRKSLKSVANKPNTVFKWSEIIRRQDGAHWLTKCNGIEIRLIPFYG